MSMHTARPRHRKAGLCLALVVGLLLSVSSGLGATSAAAQDEAPDRDYWVSRYESLRTEVETLRTRVDMLEEDYKRAKRRNYPRGAELDKLLMNLEKSRKELAEVQAEWDAFPEEARRAGALPGWFRD